MGNLQSKWVVDQLVAAYLNGVRAGEFSGVVFDDAAKEFGQGMFTNKDVNRDGRYYPSWKEGQKDLIRRITAALHADISPLGYTYFVAANIWQMFSANIASTYGAWYANGSLRLDVYYLERGTSSGNVQTANAQDPQTGLRHSPQRAAVFRPTTSQPTRWLSVPRKRPFHHLLSSLPST